MTVRIEPYGSASLLKRVLRKMRMMRREGFVPAGWDASKLWKRKHAWMFR